MVGGLQGELVTIAWSWYSVGISVILLNAEALTLYIPFILDIYSFLLNTLIYALCLTQKHPGIDIHTI